MGAISGPFTKNLLTSTMRKNSTWYRQKPPYTTRLPFTVDASIVTSGTYYKPATTFQPHYYGSPQNATLKCYDKFKSKLNTEAMVLVNAAEMHQTLSMMVKSVHLLAIIVHSVKTRPRSIRTLISRAKNIPFKKIPKRGADLFLMYHFGWDPLIKDIGACIEILQGKIPTATIKARASWNPGFREKGTRSLYNIYEGVRYRATVQMVADISISNPNLWKANQLGFVNPLAVAWELVPFSFVVDWFVNVGSFISSMTDFVGVSVTNPATTTCQYLSMDAFYVASKKSTTFLGHYDGFELDRTQKLIIPRLQIRPAKPVSPMRGVTAISLLVQQLRNLP